MYRIEKTMTISCQHSLILDYESPCCRNHGHNYKIKVGLVGNILNRNGMLCDFSQIKQIVNELDHNELNDFMSENPTAENMCFYLFEVINERLSLMRQAKMDKSNVRVEYIKIWETEDSWAEYRDEEVVDE